jgi:hypothetical protein
MSGTRKMEKFELDAYTKAREQELADEKSAQPDGASAPSPSPPGAGLPARPFEPVANAGGAPAADLPARPFDPRMDANASAHASPKPNASPNPNAPPMPHVAPPGGNSYPSAPEQQAALPFIGTPSSSWVPGEWIPPQQAEGAPPADGGAQDVEALRTGLTRKFVSLADSVTEAFTDFTIGSGQYAVELTAPQGMSTGGGKQALQHLRLLPRRQGFSVIVAGTVNQVERRAELRDHDHISVMSQVRFQRAIDISPQDWEQLLRRTEVVLNASGIQSMRTPPPRDLLQKRQEGTPRISRGAAVAFVIVLLLAAIVVWRVIVTLLNE